MGHSTLIERGKKPEKPRPDFPLFSHATGGWAKKVGGRFSYFGKVANDPKSEAAVKLWLDQKDDLLAGRTPRQANGERMLSDPTAYRRRRHRATIRASEDWTAMFDC